MLFSRGMLSHIWQATVRNREHSPTNCALHTFQPRIWFFPILSVLCIRFRFSSGRWGRGRILISLLHCFKSTLCQETRPPLTLIGREPETNQSIHRWQWVLLNQGQNRTSLHRMPVGWSAWDAAMKTTPKIRDKPRPVSIQKGTCYFILKYGTIPYFKGRVATLRTAADNVHCSMILQHFFKSRVQTHYYC